MNSGAMLLVRRISNLIENLCCQVLYVELQKSDILFPFVFCMLDTGVHDVDLIHIEESL